MKSKGGHAGETGYESAMLRGSAVEGRQKKTPTTLHEDKVKSDNAAPRPVVVRDAQMRVG